jgi:hypothetical protein
MWEKMHDGVVWFDTAACWEGSFIGKANEAVYSSTRAGGWHTDEVDPETTNYDENGKPIADPVNRKPAWDTDL